MKNPFDQQRPIEGVKNVIAVSSGKGGVGKSTVSSQLAVALAKSGARVGLLDADIYGPSAPRIFGLLNQRPELMENQRIKPLERYGVRVMSMGFLMDENSAVIWRGPMLFKAMEQLLRDVEWGELDYLVLDLPPGTGDVQLTIVQKIPVTGAVAVTTPQNVALMDVKRSIDMFNRVNVPVIGVVENMSGFQQPGQDHVIPMFPRGELPQYLDRNRLELLAQIPFYPPLAQACEIGVPLSEQRGHESVSTAFDKLAEKIKNYAPI